MNPYWTDGTATIWHANALNLPLADESVDLVVTSPPYFGLRSYQDDGAHYDGQIGSEATPAEYVDALIAATREMVRVLKPSGSIWVNLGDKYSGAQQQSSGRQSAEASSDYWKRTDPKRTGIPNKSLMLIPERYRIACVDQLGLIARAVVVWSKPNGLPESVTDRVRRSHEDWVHLTKQPRYYSAVDEIREAYSPATESFVSMKAKWTENKIGTVGTQPHNGNPGLVNQSMNPLGKLPGSVWTIPTQPLRVPPELGIDHFAAFPMEWPRRIITGWSPRDVCTACGEGRRPVADRSRFPLQAVHNGRTTAVPDAPDGRSTVPHGSTTTITGYACACTPYTDHEGTSGDRPTEHARSLTLGNGVRDNPGGGYGNAERTGPWREYHFDDWTPAPTTPGIVLDPFGGTGTVALVASALGRQSHIVDLSADYCRLARWRINDPGERARAMQVEKPPREIDGQDDLFALLDDGDVA